MGLDFTLGLASRLVAGDTTNSYVEVNGGDSASTLPGVKLRTGAAGAVTDVGALSYDALGVGAPVQLTALAPLSHALNVASDGGISLYSKGPLAGGAEFPGVILTAENGAVPAKQTMVVLRNGAFAGSHARIAASVNDGAGAKAGTLPVFLGSPQFDATALQAFTQAGTFSGNYSTAGGATIAFPVAFPTACVGVLASWANSGVAWCSPYGWTTSSFRCQVFTGGTNTEWGNGSGIIVAWIAWGY